MTASSPELTLWHHVDVLAAARAQRTGDLQALAAERVKGLILTDQRESANLVGVAAVEVGVAGDGLGRGRPFPDGEVVYRLVEHPERARLISVTQPWQRGRNDERFRAYSDPETGVLHNFVGATDPLTLRNREDDLVEVRAALWREHAQVDSFDFEHVKALHGHLFQDVYPWAGEPRTVEMARQQHGRRVGPFFESPERFEVAWKDIADDIEAAGRWRGASREEFVRDLPVIFNGMNTVHLFREGNGRTQREFMQQLAAQAGWRVDWRRIGVRENDRASQAAREGDLGPLRSALDRAVIPAVQSGPARDEYVVRKVLDTLSARDPLRPGQEPAASPRARSLDPRLTQRKDYGR